MVWQLLYNLDLLYTDLPAVDIENIGEQLAPYPHLSAFGSKGFQASGQFGVFQAGCRGFESCLSLYGE